MDNGRSSSLRERQKQQRGERMLAAASKLFNERGYPDVTIEEIAALAEVSPATVHNYYSSKDKLLLSIVEHGDAGIFGLLLDLARSFRGSPSAAMNRILTEITLRSLDYLDHRVWRHAIAASITSTDSEYRVGFWKIHERFSKIINETLECVLARSGVQLQPAQTRTLGSALYKIQHTLFTALIIAAKPDIERYKREQAEHVALIMTVIDHLAATAKTRSKALS